MNLQIGAKYNLEKKDTLVLVRLYLRGQFKLLVCVVIL